MNKFFAILLLTLVGLCVPAHADTVSVKGDTLMAISDDDTVKVDTKNLVSMLKGIIDDTIYTASDDAYYDELSLDDLDKDTGLLNNREMEKSRFEFVVAIVGVIGIVTLIIVLVVLLFWYLTRRAKYRMMEHAIENNYPLWQTEYQQLQQVQYQPVKCVQQPQSSVSDETVPLFNSQINYNTKQFKSAFLLMAVGVGAFLFFACENVYSMAMLMVIVVLIGAGKFFLAYQEQHNFLRAQQSRNAWVQQQPNQPPRFERQAGSSDSEQQVQS